MQAQAMVCSIVVQELVQLLLLAMGGTSKLLYRRLAFLRGKLKDLFFLFFPGLTRLKAEGALD